LQWSIHMTVVSIAAMNSDMSTKLVLRWLQSMMSKESPKQDHSSGITYPGEEYVMGMLFAVVSQRTITRSRFHLNYETKNHQV
jgi:hypothetical protein